MGIGFGVSKGSGVWDGWFPVSAGGRPLRRGFDGSRDPSEELVPPTDWKPMPSGRSVNPFRFTPPFPGRAMALSPNTESGSHLSRDGAGAADDRCGGVRQIGQAGIGEAGEFLVLSIARSLRGDATFSGFGCSHPVRGPWRP